MIAVCWCGAVDVDDDDDDATWILHTNSSFKESACDSHLRAVLNIFDSVIAET